MVTLGPEIGHGGEEANGVDDGNDDLGDAIAIEVLGAPIVASWIEEGAHGGRIHVSCRGFCALVGEFMGSTSETTSEARLTV